MARFNKKGAGGGTSAKRVQRAPTATNKAGAPAYRQTEKLEFVSRLLTSFCQAKYYEKADDQINRVAELCEQISDKKFLAKAAIFSRNEFGMRSITHVAVAEVVRHVQGEPWVRPFISKACRRVDDTTEIVSYYLNKYGKPLPSRLKRGIGDALGKFDAYQLAKYRGKNKEVSLVDVVNMCHPRPTGRNRTALHALIRGNLKSTETWEAKLSEAGKAGSAENVETAKAATWSSLINEGRLGYTAAVRNINNICAQADQDTFKAFLKVLVNEEQIRKSLFMPYQFMTALDNLRIDKQNKHRQITIALNQALDISCQNVPQFEGDTCVVVDYSGSMGNGVKSNRGIGSVFGAIVAKANNADFMIFGSEAAYVPYRPNDSTMTIAESFMAHNAYIPYGTQNTSRDNDLINVGHGTDLSKVFQRANRPYRRFVLFSDMQSWRSGGAYGVKTAFEDYKNRYKTDPFIYSIDLSGYGTMQFPEDKVFCVAGFNSRIFDLMKLCEADKNAMINSIENSVALM